MRKLTLGLDQIRVESYSTDDLGGGAGTVDAFQTEPNSDFNPCTGTSCTYPVQLCRTCHCAVDDDVEPRQKK